MSTTRREFLGWMSLLPFGRTGRRGSARTMFELDRFHVAGFRYHNGPRRLSTMRSGDDVQIAREPDNPHDSRAVALLIDGDRIGYVPRQQNRIVASLLDQSAPLSARIIRVRRAEVPWQQVEVAVEIRCG